MAELFLIEGTLQWAASQLATAPAAVLLAELDRRLGYRDYLPEGSSSAEAGRSAVANVTQLLALAQGQGTIGEFRAYLARLADAQRSLSGQSEAAVTLRTIHSAKGLEWPVVLIPHCNEGYLPAERADDLDEERRLLYVAITRAQQRLHLYAYGKAEQLTPFLRDARAERILLDVQHIAAVLTRDVQQLTADEARKLLCYPRVYGQQRFFTHWWQRVPAEQREGLARRVVGLAEILQARQALSYAGVAPGDVTFWQRWCNGKPADTGEFAGLQELLPRQAAGGAARQAASPARNPAPTAAGKGRSAQTPRLPVGLRVRHASYGSGTVRALESRELDGKPLWCARVEFDSRETKLIFTDKLVQITE